MSDKPFYNLILEDKWNIKIEGWDITLNDTPNHDLEKKAKERAKLSKEKFESKLEIGLNFLIKRFESLASKPSGTTPVGINFTISKFKIVVNVNFNQKSLYVKTILKYSQHNDTEYTWQLTESEKIKLDYIINIKE